MQIYTYNKYIIYTYIASPNQSGNLEIFVYISFSG